MHSELGAGCPKEPNTRWTFHISYHKQTFRLRALGVWGWLQGFKDLGFCSGAFKLRGPSSQFPRRLGFMHIELD